MNKILLKSGLFVLPFLVALCIELFVLPIDFFTFRAWEALRVEGKSITPGKYYPNMTLTKEEVGRNAHHTPYAVQKKVTWITDKYGYRKQNTDKKMDIVLIGDSFIVGDGLDQCEMLSEQLEARLGRGVYPVATANINDFLNLPRFCDAPPSVVILQKLELRAERLRKPKISLSKQKAWRIRQYLSENAVIRYIDRMQNRICKAAMLNYLKARIRDWMQMSRFDISSVRQIAGVPFIVSLPQEYDRFSPGDMDEIVSRLVQYKEILSKKNIRFIFMPMPCKETVYHHLLGLEKSSDFLDRLMEKSRLAGIETIDLKRVFEQEVKNGKNQIIYIPDDSHWNEKGVALTADVLVRYISPDVRSNQ